MANAVKLNSIIHIWVILKAFSKKILMNVPVFDYWIWIGLTIFVSSYCNQIDRNVYSGVILQILIILQFFYNTLLKRLLSLIFYLFKLILYSVWFKAITQNWMLYDNCGTFCFEGTVDINSFQPWLKNGC